MPWLDELLPTAPQEYVRDVSERTQCPPDFVGGALIVAVSTVVPRKFTVYPKQHDDWMVIPNQWAVIIGRLSAMKTPALKQALRPLHALESRERIQHGQAEAEYKASSELLEMERNAAKLKAKKLLGSGDKNAALAELNRLASDMLAPVLRRYIVNNSTVEKLAQRKPQRPTTCARRAGRLAGDDTARGRSCFASVLPGMFRWQRLIHLRPHRTRPIFLESCCLSLIGGIQPSRIASLARSAISGELDDGRRGFGRIAR